MQLQNVYVAHVLLFQSRDVHFGLPSQIMLMNFFAPKFLSLGMHVLLWGWGCTSLCVCVSRGVCAPLV